MESLLSNRTPEVSSVQSLVSGLLMSPCLVRADDSNGAAPRRDDVGANDAADGIEVEACNEETLADMSPDGKHHLSTPTGDSA